MTDIFKITKQSKHAGIMPYSYNEKRQLVFLLGKEHPERGWSDQLTYGDFGGTPELSDNNLMQTAIREGYEESMGFFGSMKDIEDNIRLINRYFYDKTAMVFLIYVPYNKILPNYFHHVYNYTHTCMRLTRKEKPFIPSCPKGFHEKVEIQWFTPKQIIKNKKQMRPAFYRFFIKEMYSQEWIS